MFTPVELLALDGVIDQETMEAAIRETLRAGIHFSCDEIQAFDGIVDDDMLTEMAWKSNITVESNRFPKRLA